MAQIIRFDHHNIRMLVQKTKQIIQLKQIVFCTFHRLRSTKSGLIMQNTVGPENIRDDTTKFDKN